MSAAATQSTRVQSERRTSSKTRPRLEVIDRSEQRAIRRRRRAMVGMFFVVLIGLFAIATAHAQLVSNQQDLDELRLQLAEAEAATARVQRAVDLASAPDVIVQRAHSLGMVRAAEPVYLAPVGPLQDAAPTVSLLPDKLPNGKPPDGKPLTGDGSGPTSPDSVAAGDGIEKSVDVTSTIAGSRAVAGAG